MMRLKLKLREERLAIAYSKFKSNRKLLLLIGLPVLGLLGCSESQTLDFVSLKKSAEQPPLILAGLAEPTELALYSDKTVKGATDDNAKVQVGDTWEDVAKMFPRPSGAYDIQDLPSNFSDKFEAHGWETGKGRGFGVILADNKVVSAIYQSGPATEDEVNKDTLQQFSGLSPLHPKRLAVGSVKYWFWHAKSQTCMICVSEMKSAHYFTMALGDDNVVKQIGVSEADATKQMAALTKQAVKNPSQ